MATLGIWSLEAKSLRVSIGCVNFQCCEDVVVRCRERAASGRLKSGREEERLRGARHGERESGVKDNFLCVDKPGRSWLVHTATISTSGDVGTEEQFKEHMKALSSTTWANLEVSRVEINCRCVTQLTNCDVLALDEPTGHCRG